MDATMLLGFVLVSLIGIATPGPDVLLTVSNGSRYGLRRATSGIVGVCLSDLFLMAAVAFGLGAILAASELFFIAVKLLGVAYLTYSGLALLRAQVLPYTEISVGVMSARDLPGQLFARSFLVAFTNVKVWLFFAAFLPQFVNPHMPQIPQYMTLAVVFETLNVAILLSYAALGAGAMHVFKGNMAMWMDRVSGVVLLLFAVGLMFYQRGGLPA